MKVNHSLCALKPSFHGIDIYMLRNNVVGNVQEELRIGGIFLPRNRPTLGPQLQSQNP